MRDIDRFVAYEASAGSGKTFALTLRYISLLFLGNQPSKILALTFTNKASNEMKTRIQNTLKNLESDEYKTELSELSKILKRSEKDILKDKDRIYENFLKQDNYILTIDKFCSLILRKFAFYIGLMPDFTIEQKDSLALVILHFVKSLQKYGLYGEFIKFSVFEDKKLNAVFDILYFFYEKFFVLPESKRETEFSEQVVLKTFNDLKKMILECDKLSPSGKKAISLQNIEEIYKAGWFCKESLEEYHYFKKCYQPSWDDEFEKLKSKIRSYFLYRESKYINNLLKFFKIFKEVNYNVKKELNDLKFLDITNFTYEILNREVERDFFYFRLDAKFDHLLLDEFQDTSVLQFEILKPLFDEIVSGIGASGDRSIFYVGDIKQSIYRFRGGNKELFYEVARRYALDVKRLNVNYRSKQEIVEFVNQTFMGKMEGYFPQIPNDKKGGGYAKVIKSDELLKSSLDIIVQLLDNGINEDDIAILTYTNDDTFTLEEEIKKEIQDIKVATQTTSLLISNHEVKIILECMKYIYFEEKFYLYNLLVLLGKDENDAIELKGFSKEMSPLDFTCECIKKFGLNSLAVLDFLNELRSYDDMESLLFGLDDFKVQASQKDIQGLKILTIHKSKGLEFKHLIVCDRLKRKNSDRKSWVLSYEDLKPKELFLKAKNRECVDKEYKTALEKEKKLQLEDELNAIYVAFTRAKESLFIIEKEKNSAFSVLNLKEESFGEFPKSTGEKMTILKPSFDYEEPSVGKQKDVMTFEEESDNDKESDFEAINFGLATHYMLEMLDGFDKESLDGAYQAMKNRYQDLLDIQKTEDIRQRVENLLTNSEFMKIRDDSSKLYKELPVVFEGKLKQIDLLVENHDDIKVIDYKTSKFVQNAHIKQVKEYMDIIREIKEKKVSGYLCYLQKENIKIVEVNNE